MKSNFEAIITGCRAGESDFAAALDRLAKVQHDAFFERVVSPIVAAQAAPAAAKSCSVGVIGHSERLDDPPSPPAQRRAKELLESRLRAASAEKFVFDTIVELVDAAGGTPRVGQASMQNGVMFTVAAGVADPSSPNQSMSPTGRRTAGCGSS